MEKETGHKNCCQVPFRSCKGLVCLKGELQALKKIAKILFMFREMDESSIFQVAESWEEDSCMFSELVFG